MSQKEHINQGDKWRDLEEKLNSSETKTAGESSAPIVDDEHLLQDENLNKTARDKIGLLEKQIEQFKEQMLRKQAETENMHRRMEQEVVKARKFGVERLIAELIPVVDSLIRGLEGTHTSDCSDASVQSLRKGMELTLDMLNKLLEKNGVSSIVPAVGDVFNPSLHEAMSMQPDPNGKPNIVLQILQKGYALHDRVIRAAMVVVSA